MTPKIGSGVRRPSWRQHVTTLVLLAVTIHVGGSPASAQTGLVAAYSFDEGTGTTVADASGNNHTGTLSGATWTTAGRYGSALTFNGTTAKVTVLNVASLGLTTGMTLEAWVYPTVAPTGWRAVIDKNVDGYYLMASSSPNNRPAVGGTFTAGNQNVMAPSGLAVNTWTHLAATFDGAMVRLYVNGVQVASQAQAAPLRTTAGTLQIGADSYAGENFVGRIDELRIYNRALTAAEIQTDMNTAVAPATPDTQPPTTPSNLAATAASGSQINLSWTAATDNVGVTGYPVERCQGAGCTSFAPIGTAAGTTYSDAGLTANTSYSYQVRATDAAGNPSGYSNVASATTPAPDTQPPTAPGTLTATVVSGSQINLSWTASTDNVGVTGYPVERCQGAGCTSFSPVGTAAGPTYSDTGLAANMSYSYRVRATDAAGNPSGYSNVASATTPATDTQAPTAPTNLSATAVSWSQINLSWTASTDNVGVTGYPVERCQGAGCTSFAPVGTAAGPTYSDTGLAANTSYSYRVRATDAAGNPSGYSSVASATTPAPIAGLVAAWGFNEGAGTTVGDASGNNHTGTVSGATWTTAGRYGSALVFTGTTAKVTVLNAASFGLTTGMTLEAWVYPTAVPTGWRAVIDKTVDGYYLMASSSPNDRPAVGGTWAAGNQNVMAPSGLAVNTWTHLAATFDGAMVRLYVNGVEVASQAQTAPLAITTGTLQIGADSYAGENFAGRIDEVRIYNRALAAAEIQTDMNTAVGSAPTPDTQAPTVPGNLAATAASGSQINLSWTAATDNVGVTAYPVERCQGAGCTSFAPLGTAAVTTYSDAGLTANTSYSYRVRATDAAGNPSGYSNVASATTPATDTQAPTAPTNLSATAVSWSQINLSWTASTDDVGVTGYPVERCQGAGCTSFAPLGTAAGTTYADAALAANTSYSYRVRATDAAGNPSGYSNVASATTPATTPGLVAAYSFNEGSGTTVGDASGNNNTGTVSGATWTTAGRYGSALVFDGTTAKVTVPNAGSLGLTTGMTLEAWVYPTAAPTGWRAVIDKNVDGYYLMASSSPNDRPAVGGTWAAGNQNVMAPSGLAVNTWTHLAATFDGAMVRLYVNGVQVASQAQVTPLRTTTGTLQIGADGYAGENFAGRIDEVRIYNRALTAAEIQADIVTPVGGTSQSDTTPPTVSLTAPAAGSTVFSLVRVSATASDNVGVGGVQFLLDGAPLGTEATSAPYAVVWDTRSAAPGSHVLSAVARDFAGNTTPSAPVSITVTATGPSNVGQWAAPFAWPIVAVNVVLLRTGEVLAWDGQSFGGHDARIWNPTTNTFTAVPNNQTNMFCVGQCALPDGRILVAGGHITDAHVGVTDTNIFDPAASTWTKVASMSYARWYPTATMLPDGRVLVTAGEINCNGCVAVTPEVYNLQTNVWTQLSGASLDLPYYPHMFVLPDGRVLAAATAEDAIVTRVLDVLTQTWSIVDPVPVDGGSSAMYLPGKVMKSGTSFDPDMPSVPSAATTYVLDITQPSPIWQQTDPMTFPRTYHTQTLLPDGTVFVSGGGVTTDPVDPRVAVGPAELWSPVTETWTTMASLSVPRLYHSTALLLPDGRVLVAGGGRFFGQPDPSDQLSAEIYSPPYLFKGARPAITSAPATATYGASIIVETPDAARIATVSLIRLGSVTHAFNMDQRFLPLGFAAGGGSLSVQAPASASLAPPGYYMLFIVDADGVPSVAAILKLQ